MTARKVVTPALAMAGPRSTKAFFVFSNLEPVNKMSKRSVLNCCCQLIGQGEFTEENHFITGNKASYVSLCKRVKKCGEKPDFMEF